MSFQLHSLRTRLVLAFCLLCLVEAILVAFWIRYASQEAFQHHVREIALDAFKEEATAYYQLNGSWAGFERMENTLPQTFGTAVMRQPGSLELQQPERPKVLYGLTDEMGKVVKPIEIWQLGIYPPQDVLDHSIPFIISGKKVGYILLPQIPQQFNPREQQYVQRTRNALYSALGSGLVVAMILGFALAWRYTKPLKQLTSSAQTMASGQHPEPLPVAGKDEISLLTEAFNQMSAKVNKANELRKQMVADIAHDLNTPLTVISGYLEAFQEGALKATPERLEVIFHETNHLARLVQDLRTLSLADAGELSLQKSQTSAADLFAQVIQAFAHQAETAQIHLQMDVPSPASSLYIDGDRVRQVLGNLVRNALRYTPAGGFIRLGAIEMPDKFRLTITDSGTGIPEAQLPYIFDRFYRADKSRQKNEGESGLGLAIVKSLIELHGARVSVTSSKEGTCFCLDFPKS